MLPPLQIPGGPVFQASSSFCKEKFGGVQTMAAHFAINFFAITTRGWLDSADSFAPFSILQIVFFEATFSAKSNVDRVAVG